MTTNMFEHNREGASCERPNLFCDYAGKYHAIIMWFSNPHLYGDDEKFDIKTFTEEYYSADSTALDFGEANDKDRKKIESLDKLATQAKKVLSKGSLNYSEKKEFFEIVIKVAEICGSELSLKGFRDAYKNFKKLQN